jgi:hypothetical protein
MSATTFIFNQYYIDFLKRIKNVAKENKDTSTTAKGVYKAVKEHYSTLDKSSDEYINYVNETIPSDVWDKYTSEDWLQDNKNIELYRDISLGNIAKLMDDEYLCHHFLTVFYIFRNSELSDDVSSLIVKILQSVDGKELLDELHDEKIKNVLVRLRELRDKKIKEKAGIDMNFIEDTTLGKLAKEILEDVDVGKLQKSMQNNNDILKAIGDPDSGFADIITNVSKKMANKISSGELKQENLIQDAMKFASIMPNLFGGGGNAGNAPNDRRNRPTKQPDLSNIMSMMSSMMANSGNDCDSMQDLFKAAKATKPGTKKVFNESAFKKIAKAKKLKKKLHDKKKADRNAQQTSATEAETPADTLAEPSDGSS